MMLPLAPTFPLPPVVATKTTKIPILAMDGEGVANRIDFPSCAETAAMLLPGEVGGPAGEKYCRPSDPFPQARSGPWATYWIPLV